MSKKPGHFWLDFFACFLIPAYTLLFAGSVEWFGTNFSVIAVTGPDHYRGFIYWGILSGGYFFVMLIRLSFRLPSRWQSLGETKARGGLGTTGRGAGAGAGGSPVGCALLPDHLLVRRQQLQAVAAEADAGHAAGRTEAERTDARTGGPTDTGGRG